MLKPRPLRFGDTIGVIAPSSPPHDSTRIDAALNQLARSGFSVKVGKNLRKTNGYLAGSDEQRLADLHQMFADPNVSAVFCLRGGYGATRLLDHIDYRLVRSSRKLLCGYSDVTALQLAIMAKAGLCTFHGPMLMSLFDPKKSSVHSFSSWLRALMVSEPYGDIRLGMPKKGSSIKVLHSGSARGRLLGGNLSLICSLIGTPYLPSFKNTILFLEDVNEPPYRIDRMLTQLLLSGTLQGVRGVAIGTFNEKDDFASIFKERLTDLEVPVLYGLPFGHIDHQCTLPQGVTAEIDTRTKSLWMLEAASAF